MSSNSHQKALLVYPASSTSLLSMLETAITVLQVLFVLALLVVSKRLAFEKIFRGTIVGLIGVISLLTVLVNFQKDISITSILSYILPASTVEAMAPLTSIWPSALLHSIMKVCGAFCKTHEKAYFL